MEVIIRSSREDAAKLVAQIVARSLRRKPNLVLGLATGRTMDAVYALLVAMHRDGALSFAHVTTFNLDEYVGLDASHPASFRRYLRERVLDRVTVADAHLLDGQADPRRVSAETGDAIAAAPVDVAFVGIGENGHLAFNDPPADFET